MSIRVLAVGAHPDDVELGAGGVLLRHQAMSHEILIVVMSDGETEPPSGTGILRMKEAQESASSLGASVRLCELPNMAVPLRRAIQEVERAVADFQPDIVYVHWPDDSHQDHRTSARATISGARNVETLLFYESPSSRNFSGTIYADIEPYQKAKLQLIAHHKSQLAPVGHLHLTTIDALSTIRGWQGGTASAEAFAAERMRLQA